MIGSDSVVRVAQIVQVIQGLHYLVERASDLVFYQIKVRLAEELQAQVDLGHPGRDQVQVFVVGEVVQQGDKAVRVLEMAQKAHFVCQLALADDFDGDFFVGS